MLRVISRKLAASSVNCGLTFLAAVPFMQIAPQYWRGWAVAVFFGMQLIDRCPGMLVTRQYWQRRPRMLVYSTLYTASFATLLWYVWFPLDLALADGALQLGCIYWMGDTVHGYLTGARVMSEDERVLDEIMQGRCPNCGAKSATRYAAADEFQCSECAAVYVLGQGLPYKLRR